MPPRVVKRGGGAAKRGGRVTRSAVKAQTPPVESAADDESVNIAEVSVSDAVETPEVDEEENHLDDSKQLDDSEAAANPDNVVTPQSKIL